MGTTGRTRALVVAITGALLCVPAPARAAAPSDWVRGYGGRGFDGSVQVEALPGGGVLALTKHGFGPGGSISLRRLDRQGGTVWERSIPEAASSGFYGSEFRTSLLLADGRVLFGGYSDADGSPDALFDAVLLAVDPATGASSTVTWGGPAKDMADTIAQCADGSLYVAGGVWDGSAAPGETVALGGTDIFVTKFTAGLERTWTRQLGSHRNDMVFAARCAADGSVDLNAWAAGEVNGQGNDDYYNFFTARLSASGATLRTVATGIDPGEWSPQSGAYAPDGSYYVVGESNGAYPHLQCTEWAIGGSFVARYASDGTLMWRALLPCSNLNRRIVIGASGDLFVLGTAGNRRIAGQQKFGGDDFLLHRYSPDGTRLWTRQFGSSLDDVGSSLSVDGKGGVYVGAYMKGSYGGYQPVDDWDAVVMHFDVGDAVPVPPAAPDAVPCTAEAATQLPVSATPHAMSFVGSDLGEASMAALWDYASTHGPNDFGRLIGAGQDWFGSCRYPGIGLGTGSGHGWWDRNVTLWVWADGVDLTAARDSVLAKVAELVAAAPPTTVASTTTTAAPAVSVAPLSLATPPPVVAPLVASTGEPSRRASSDTVVPQEDTVVPSITAPVTKASSTAQAVAKKKVTRAPVKQTRRPAKPRVRPLAAR